MNQMTTMMLMMSGLTLLFYIMGLTPTNPLLNLVLNPASMSTVSFTISVLAALSIGGGLIFGFVSRNVELQVMSVIIPLFATIMWGFSEVIIKIMAYYPIAVLLFGPLMFLFVMMLVELWRGRD